MTDDQEVINERGGCIVKPVLTALCFALLSSATCAAPDPRPTIEQRVASLERRVAAIEEYIEVTTESHQGNLETLKLIDTALAQDVKYHKIQDERMGLLERRVLARVR